MSPIVNSGKSATIHTMSTTKWVKYQAFAAVTFIAFATLISGCSNRVPTASKSSIPASAFSRPSTVSASPSVSAGNKGNPLTPTVFLDLTVPGYKLGTQVRKPAGATVLIVIHAATPGTMELSGDSAYAVKLSTQLYGGLTIKLVKGINPDVVFVTNAGKSYLVAKLTGL